MKLAIITTHPIQYNAPWFRLLAQRKKIIVKVYYTWSQTKTSVEDRTFGKTIKWDIPLLEGYDYEFIENISRNPGSHHRKGIQCPSLIPAIKDWNPNVILVFGWNFQSHFEVMEYFKGKLPIWFRGDSTLIDKQSVLKRQLRRTYLRYVYRYVDKAFYVGTENKKYFEAYGLDESQLIFAPHAIDNDRFIDTDAFKYENKAKDWRKKLGFNDKDLVILFSGKFENKKSPLLLIEAFKLVNKDQNSKLKLLMVGNGPLEEALKKYSGSDDNITFLPFQNQTFMPLVYRMGDIFCLPSSGPGETWGLAVNEAMASARGAIVSNQVGCAVDLVKNGMNGYIFKSGDIGALTRILKSLTKEKCKQLGDNSHSFIQAWRFDKIVSSIEKEIFKECNKVMRILYIGQYAEGTTSRMRADELKKILNAEDFLVIDTLKPFMATSRLLRSFGFRYKMRPLISNISNYVLEKFNKMSQHAAFDLIWVDKGVFLKPRIVKLLKNKTPKLVHYTPDMAFYENRSVHFEKAMAFYDFLITTKTNEVQTYLGFIPESKCVVTTQGFDLMTHKYSKPFAEKKNVVCFIGLYESHRGHVVQALLDNKIPVVLAGKGWSSFVSINKNNKYLTFLGKGLFSRDYAECIAQSKFGLGLYSKRFPELHTTRTFEIPACGTALLTERNSEINSFFSEENAILYSDIPEMIDKIKYFLAHPESLERVTLNGYNRVHKDGYDYNSILKGILNRVM